MPAFMKTELYSSQYHVKYSFSILFSNNKTVVWLNYSQPTEKGWDGFLYHWFLLLFDSDSRGQHETLGREKKEKLKSQWILVLCEAGCATTHQCVWQHIFCIITKQPVAAIYPPEPVKHTNLGAEADSLLLSWRCLSNTSVLHLIAIVRTHFMSPGNRCNFNTIQLKSLLFMKKNRIKWLLIN